jgi:hypothetical protein
MPRRSLLFLAVVILAATIPFLLREAPPDAAPDSSVVAPSSVTGLFGPQRAAAAKQAPAGAPSYVVEAARAELARNRKLLATSSLPPSPIGNLPAVPLPDALRFDVTPTWVRSIWPRVAPQRMETGWFALRVPLVTGTEPTDVAGSLTYFFDSQDYVERITLSGLTDDAELLSSLVQQYYGLQPYAATGRGLLLSFYQGVPIGMLRIEDASGRRPGELHSRYHVQLELNRPRPGATLSQPGLQPLQRLRDAKLL